MTVCSSLVVLMAFGARQEVGREEMAEVAIESGELRKGVVGARVGSGSKKRKEKREKKGREERRDKREKREERREKRKEKRKERKEKRERR